MIRLFLADIDGCLSEPYTPFRLDGLATLRAYAERSRADERCPRVGICTGRAYAYAEATAQAVGVSGPVLFESGGGVFDLDAARITWSPALTPDVEAALAECRAFLVSRVAAGSATVSFDYGKRSQAGVVSPVVGEAERFVPEVERFVGGLDADLAVYHTPYSVDVVPAALTKARAVRRLAEAEGLALAEVAFIGDTNGDAAAIAAVGAGFAPANGSAEARAAAGVVTGGAVLDGVLEAYRRCLHQNGVGDDEA